MKKIFLFLIITSAFLFACNKNSTVNNSEKDTVTVVKFVNFNPDGDTSSACEILADPIIYDVQIKVSDPADDWMVFRLKNTDVKPLQKQIFKDIYSGKLIPYHYRFDDSIIPIDSIRVMEKLLDTTDIADIQFWEKWYFDPDSIKFYKKVESMIFGYEHRLSTGEVVGYKALFRIYLDKKHNQKTSK